MPKSRQTVLIVGGGASGTLLAAHLLRRSRAVSVVLIEPRTSLGRGMAYSTECPRHLLNVPAIKMSAFPDDPPHFVRWLRRSGMDFADTAFVPRRIFGRYLADVLREARDEASDVRFHHIRAKAVGAIAVRDFVQVRLEDGNHVDGDALVIAMGNAAPADWRDLSPEAAASGRYFGLTWQEGALQPDNPEAAVLLLGTGLTAVDALLALRENGHRGPVHMTSRRGLLPQAHKLFQCAPLPCIPASSPRELMRNMRAAAADAEVLHGNWRVAIDGVRPQTNALWQALTLAGQRRFLRHARALWDVHRHRMAPEIAEAVRDELERGTLTVSAGRTGMIALDGVRFRVPLRRRGSNSTETLEADHIVNCTGPEVNPRRLRDAFVKDLIGQGLLQPHALGMGVAVDADGALTDSRGRSSEHIFALGPLRIGTLIETVAMPEIRQQASDLASRLIGEPAPHAEDFLAGFAYAI